MLRKLTGWLLNGCLFSAEEESIKKKTLLWQKPPKNDYTDDDNDDDDNVDLFIFIFHILTPLPLTKNTKIDKHLGNSVCLKVNKH